MAFNTKKDIPLIIISLALLITIVGLITLYPEQGTKFASAAFDTLTTTFGSAVLILTFLSLLFLIWLALSKYGNIRLGNSKPEYSTFSWVAMMICAGLGSATVYWGFAEWSYYLMTPPFGIASGSPASYEWATAYNFFHWGISGWGIYCIAALPVAYHFHVRNNRGLSLSAVFEAVTNREQGSFFGKIVDMVFIFTTFGGLSITLGVSVPMLAEGISRISGLENTFLMKVAIVLGISVVYSCSSYVGLEKGMRRISDMNSYFALAFALIIFLVGPTIFIMKAITNGLGIMLDNFIMMSFWTDPINNSGFPEGWTIFYWLYWVAYCPFMALFVAKVSRGRTIREVIMNMLVSGSAGCWLFLGIIENYTMHAHMTGKVDFIGTITGIGDSVAIIDTMETLPFSALMIILFTVISVLFLATTLDSASYTLAATVTPGLKNNEDPSPLHRLFWCIMIAAVPLAMMFTNAPISTIKTCAIVTGIPLSIVMAVLIVGFYRWMKEDYGEASLVGKKLINKSEVPKIEEINRFEDKSTNRLNA